MATLSPPPHLFPFAFFFSCLRANRTHIIVWQIENEPTGPPVKYSRSHSVRFFVLFWVHHDRAAKGICILTINSEVKIHFLINENLWKIGGERKDRGRRWRTVLCVSIAEFHSSSILLYNRRAFLFFLFLPQWFRFLAFLTTSLTPKSRPSVNLVDLYLFRPPEFTPRPR